MTETRQDQFPSDSSESDEGIDRSFLEFSSSTEKTKIFHDMVHPHLELPAICSLVINTPQFQRLRNLKQLGLCYYVYPSAAHNRFEHCIGTSYLAGKYGKTLRKNQPELNITDTDILCLYLGGLCHDLGHGPFSHSFECFVHSVGFPNYSHETMSLRMLDYLIEGNNLKSAFEAENLTERDLTFIKEIIFGHPLDGNENFVGRPPCKYFLYQIVSNDRTKIDVDKFDYLLRDCKQLNVATVFDYQRVLDNSRVVGMKDGAVCDHIEDDTPTIIVYRNKISDTLEDLFRSRFSMHKKAYQHRVTKVIEEMTLDALKAAEPHFQVPGSNGKTYKLSTAWQDVSAFMKLTDSVFEWIQHWNFGGSKAANILNRLVHRNLYKFLGCFSGKLEQSVLDELQGKDSGIRFIESKINFGSGNKNPLNEVLFYEKSRPNRLIRKNFPNEPEVRRTFIVYSRNEDESEDGNDVVGDDNIEYSVRLQTVKKHVKHWSEKHKISLEYE
ncbi:Deoxynucleoside triphosphate triphosphohydrolase SAMHD1 [Orchesella cincta]|uniref:Deoxynucleoside triphosphate triphosphohydrolase SAMHD1 n=1 Tax=Orchesella cincta TaxID=48709 RepID=A0A1D2MUQ2_ORCCI|nr:Deoxynucleoside triphosphate triphosphohydrolase SAMHD1 [Orchesella cincta]